VLAEKHGLKYDLSYVVSFRNSNEFREFVKGVDPVIHLALRFVVNRKRIPRELFADHNHYLMYKMFFRGYPYTIGISNKYLVVETVVPLRYEARKRYFYYNDDKEVSNEVMVYKDLWVFISNGDGRLYVNHLNRYSHEILKSTTVIPLLKIMSDKEIREGFFGFKRDCEEATEIAIPDSLGLEKSNTARVQGEIVFQYGFMDNEGLANDMVNLIVSSVDPQLNRIVNNYVFYLVSCVLREHGFSVIEHGNLESGTLTITLPRTVNKKFGSGRESLLSEKVKAIIVKALEFHKVFTEKCSKYVTVYVDYRRGFGEHYNDIRIDINTSYTNVKKALVEYVNGEALKLVQELIAKGSKKAYTVYWNNHTIKIESLPLEHSFEIPEELNPLANVYPEYDVVVSANIRDNSRFFVLKGFKAVVTHDEHGLANVTFTDQGLVRIQQTLASFQQADMQNRLAVNKLMKTL